MKMALEETIVIIVIQVYFQKRKDEKYLKKNSLWTAIIQRNKFIFHYERT